jgi:hypothetical protein
MMKISWLSPSSTRQLTGPPSPRESGERVVRKCGPGEGNLDTLEVIFLGGLLEIPSIAQLIPVLQTAIGPMILISGLGLILLTMTNRLGRAIDRARILAAELANCPKEKKGRIVSQLTILWRRARLIRASITFASLSALSSAVLIIVLFFTALEKLELAGLIITVFIFSMMTLIGALVLFILDINQSLTALKFELQAEK